MQKETFYKLFNKLNNEAEEIDRLRKFRGLINNICEINLESFLNLYFSKDSIKNFEVSYLGNWNKWAKTFASSMIQGQYINPLDLEPFVARYVLAINKAGVQTFLSCDGWHEHSRHILIIGFKGRYNRIWHKIICSFLNEDNGIKWRYDDMYAILNLPKTDRGKINKYVSLNKNAEQIELLQNKIIKIKRKLIIKAKNKVKNPLSDEEIEEYMNNLVKEILQENNI